MSTEASPSKGDWSCPSRLQIADGQITMERVKVEEKKKAELEPVCVIQ
jgi:hypothetical protein